MQTLLLHLAIFSVFAASTVAHADPLDVNAGSQVAAPEEASGPSPIIVTATRFAEVNPGEPPQRFFVSDKVERLNTLSQRPAKSAAQATIARQPVRLIQYPAPDTGVQWSPRKVTVLPGDQATPLRLEQAEVDREGGDLRLTLNLQDEDLRDLLDFISKEAELNILASESVRGKVTATLTRVDVQSALAAILRLTGYVARRDGDFLYVGTPADLARMDQLRDSIETRIYRTNYVTAAELQKLITPLLTPEIGSVTVSTASEVDIPADTVRTGGDDFAGNEVVLVNDFRTALARIDALIAEVDQRPRQVVIEAVILAVNLDDSHKFGINFELLNSQANARLVSGSPLASLASIDTSNGGLNLGIIQGDVAAFIHALETIGDTNVIASPRLLCLNKQRAEILIGDQKGFISTTQTETSTTQTVEFLDIGTQLRIRPFISDDGTIRMEVHPELSTGDVKLLGGFALPEKTVTQVTTNIMCRDGATVVIGGLIREDYTRSLSQVAGFGNMPFVGRLLRNTNEGVTRSEIVVLITPRIIQDPAAMCDEKPQAADIFGRHASIESRRITPIARRYYGDRYYRLAQSAWVADNPAGAMRYLDLALRFDPRDRRAWHLYGIVSQAAPEYVMFGDEFTEALPLHGAPQFNVPPPEILPLPNGIPD